MLPVGGLTIAGFWGAGIQRWILKAVPEMEIGVSMRERPKAYCGVSTKEKNTVAVHPRGVPLNEMNRGRCQKLAFVSLGSWKSSAVRESRSTGEPSRWRVGMLRSLRRDKVGRARTTKCRPPQIISIVSSKRVWSWTDGVRLVLMIRLPRGDQKADSMWLSRKKE